MSNQSTDSNSGQTTDQVEKTLVPITDSEVAEQAYGFALASFPDTEITVFHCIETPEGYWSAFVKSEEQYPQYESRLNEANKLLETVKKTAAGLGIEINTLLTSGRPANAIVEQAVDGDYDQIVIGSHGRRGLARIIYGSVSETVVRRSPIPVVVVRLDTTRPSKDPMDTATMGGSSEMA